uniref:Uncharacterized protein n=1 Tax=Nothobranchius pienaari TaxID=704102 RepID=A0A1A8PHM9_9TELE
MEKKRLKPSGAQFRKKRKEEEEKRGKDAGALRRYFGMTSAATEEQPSTSTAHTSRPVFELEEGQSAGTTSPQEDTLERPTSICELDEGQPAATSPQQDTSEKPERSTNESH